MHGSEGAGLGNAFLSNIAAVDGIFHVCRAFDGDDILIMDAELDNTDYYAEGLRTELHWVLDGGVLNLDIWVPFNLVNRPYY